MRAHEFDPVSFFSGLILTGIGVLFLIPGDIGGLIDLLFDAGDWVWPALFLIVGIAILVPVLGRRGDRDHAGDDAESI